VWRWRAAQRAVVYRFRAAAILSCSLGIHDMSTSGRLLAPDSALPLEPEAAAGAAARLALVAPARR